MYNNKKLGAFIVPTGVGASIGGFAGDASPYAREFSKHCKLIVNPNVVNAGGFSGINENMFYVEGYSLDEFFKGNLNLVPSHDNKIGIIFDKGIPEHIMNVHLNTMNAVKAVYGLDIPFYEVTEEPVGVEFRMEESGISTGRVKNTETLLKCAKSLLAKGAEALAIVCMFENPTEENPDYQNGEGTDPVGGVEAIISHYISKELQVPCAHSPAFDDLEITTDLIDGKAASEYITPTFLPCILLGLSNAPKLSKTEGISVNELDFLLMPHNCLGSTPVFECVKRNIPVFAIEENTTVLDVTTQKIFPTTKGITLINSYRELLEKMGGD
ncbi:MAG: DUF3326 domain-containing protein [Fusobacterium sp.]|nr:DUF3326 domain-containing protein [Fusobacterium sp.]